MSILAAKPLLLYRWILAARPKTLSISVIPMLIGALLARNGSYAISWNLLCLGLLSAILIQIGTNLINDAIDFTRGADTSLRLGPARATQKGWLSFRQVYWAGIFSFLLAFVCAIPLIEHGGMPIFFCVVASILCGYCYTGGPYPLAYSGLADPCVFLFFGLAATLAMYYIQSGTMDLSPFLAGSQIGLLAMAVIGLNNLRDHVSDAKAGRRSLPVRFGICFGRWEVCLSVFIPFLLNFLWIPLGYSLAAYLPWVAFPVALSIVRLIWKHEPGVLYSRAFGLSALLHMFFGILLLIGFIIR